MHSFESFLLLVHMQCVGIHFKDCKYKSDTSCRFRTYKTIQSTVLRAHLAHSSSTHRNALPARTSTNKVNSTAGTGFFHNLVQAPASRHGVHCQAHTMVLEENKHNGVTICPFHSKLLVAPQNGHPPAKLCETHNRTTRCQPPLLHTPANEAPPQNSQASQACAPASHLACSRATCRTHPCLHPPARMVLTGVRFRGWLSPT